MPSTFVHGLLPGACLWLGKRGLPELKRTQCVIFCLWVFVLSSIPDSDFIPALFYPDHWMEFHRNWGHNLFSACLFVAIGQWVLRRWIVAEFSQKSAWTLTAILVGSHLLLDSMTYAMDGSFLGVPLLYPIVDWNFYLPLPLFPSLHMETELHFVVAFVKSPDFWRRALFQEIFAGACLFGVYYVAWGGFPLLSNGFRSREEVRAGD